MEVKWNVRPVEGVCPCCGCTDLVFIETEQQDKKGRWHDVSYRACNGCHASSEQGRWIDAETEHDMARVARWEDPMAVKAGDRVTFNHCGEVTVIALEDARNHETAASEGSTIPGWGVVWAFLARDENGEEAEIVWDHQLNGWTF